MPTPTTRGFDKYATATDPPDGASQQNHLIDDIEELVAFRAKGTGALPAVPPEGVVFFHTGTRTHYWSDGTAWRPVQGLPRRIVTASETLTLVDSCAAVDVASASAVVITVPPASSVAWLDFTTIQLLRKGTGTLTVAAGAGVTIRTPASDGKLAAKSQYSLMELQRLGLDEWLLVGDRA